MLEAITYLCHSKKHEISTYPTVWHRNHTTCWNSMFFAKLLISHPILGLNLPRCYRAGSCSSWVSTWASTDLPWTSLVRPWLQTPGLFGTLLPFEVYQRHVIFIWIIWFSWLQNIIWLFDWKSNHTNPSPITKRTPNTQN